LGFQDRGKRSPSRASVPERP